MSATLAEVLAEAVHEALENCLHLDERNIPGGGRQCAAYANRIAPAVLAWLEGLLTRTVLAFDCLEDDVPALVDVPDDYEWGMHDAASVILAAAREGVRDE